MAVLIEGISVVVRVDCIYSKFSGSWEQFKRSVPNETLCSDNELARVGFMTPNDTQAYVEHLNSNGLQYVESSQAADLVVADQRRGFGVRCEWAEFGHINWNGDSETPIAVCRLKGTKEARLFTPEGWDYNQSLSSNHEFVRNGWVSEFMDFLRNENGIDVYRDLRTGKEVYVGRTNL